MGKAILRGALCAVFTAVYIYILLVFTYFNITLYGMGLATALVFPLGCGVIAAVFAAKERLSKFFVSLLSCAAVSAALAYLGFRLDPAGNAFRLLYGFFPHQSFGERQTAVAAVSALASVAGYFIAFVISLVNTIKIKRFINSLEVKP